MAVSPAPPDAYEILALQADPLYGAMLRGTDLVKAFIIRHQCIVYGGTAIDYAMRLRGSSIYDDSKLAIPDLDVYSSDSVGLAYKFAQQLYEDGFPDARAKTAIHSTTMKVDLGSNHWIADISYLPNTVIAKIPTVEYMGMLCAHPDFQRIDLHSSLTYPYDNAPSEVIFARWKKDVCRLGKIDSVYPIVGPVTGGIVSKSTNSLVKPVSRPRRDLPLAGWAAYACIIAAAVRNGAKLNDGELSTTFNASSNAYTYPSPSADSKGCEYYCDNVVPTHAGWATAMPPRQMCDDGTILYSTANRLLSVVDIDGVQSVCVNGVLMYMLAAHFMYECATARWAYATLWRIANEYGDKMPFLRLSATVYGSRNINTAQLESIARIDPSRATGDTIPRGWRPAKGKAPTFEYVGSIWEQDGRKLG